MINKSYKGGELSLLFIFIFYGDMAMKKLFVFTLLTITSAQLFAFDICGRCVQNCMDNGQSKNNCMAFNCAPQCGGITPKSTIDYSCVDYYTRVEGMEMEAAIEYCQTDYDPEQEIDLNDII